MRVLNTAYDQSMELEEQASMTLAGGILQHGCHCGMIWGSTLAAGAQACRLYGAGPEAETRAVLAAQSLVALFRNQNKKINCLDITGLDRSSSTWEMNVYYFLKGGFINCGRMGTRFSRAAYKNINESLEKMPESVSPPVSCASLWAEKTGTTGMHKTMVAGLAGGIGLCGGGCGALGAAVWYNELNSLKNGDGPFDYKKPRGLETIEKFKKYTGGQLECSKITGRQFADVKEHAAFLSDGGCTDIIEFLAAERPVKAGNNQGPAVGEKK